MTPALFAFLHHIAAFVIFGALFAELMLLKPEPTQAQIRLLPRIDAMYGIAAMVLIVVGLVRVHFTEKGAAYYLHSATFIAKIVLFVVVGLLSIQPTLRFMAWRRELQAGRPVEPSPEMLARIRKFVHAELGLLLIVILCAVLMARGIGYFG
jgi:putative membrane protein